MMVVKMLLWSVLLLLIPTAVGTLFFSVDKHTKNLPFAWISGQMTLWAGFEVIAVPFILREGTLTRVVQIFSGYVAVLLLAALAAFAYRKKNSRTQLRVVESLTKKQRTEKIVLWVIFWAILAFQVIQAVRLAYADGDDAYYIAVANLAEESDTMYQKAAYSGGAEALDARYGLAPFPIWIAFLARISGIRTSGVAHVMISPLLIAMTYAIFYLLGSRLFAKNRVRIPLFLIFTELLVLFGDYSFYTAENFMIARSRQGKAALGNIIIPMLLFMLYLLLEFLQENKKISLSYWGLLLCTLTAACLCSSLGTLLVCMLVGVTGLCAAFCYRKWKFLILLAACCIPCVGVALLYVLL